MEGRARSRSLVEAAQRGDEAAFAELVRAYQDLAVAYATAILGDRHLAEDAAQEAFVEAHRALPALREPLAFAAWLRRILAKHCDRLTRRRRHPAVPLEAALGLASAEPGPPEAAEASELRGAVRRAIAALPPAQQEAVLLHYMGDRDQGEIAEFLGITPNAVKTRLYAARQRLRPGLAEIENGLRAARPSRDPTFAEGVRRMIRPDALKSSAPLVWSPGIGTDVWDLFCAAEAGDLPAVRRLVERDPRLARTDYEGRPALSFAVRTDRAPVARFLLERGADPVGSGTPDTLVQVARDRGLTEMQGILEGALARTSGTRASGEPAAAAIRDRDLDRLRRLLDGAPELVRAPDARSNEPIHWAAMTRQLDAIDELAARGADLDARRSDGARPIQLARGDYHYRGWMMPDLPAPWEAVVARLRARGAYCDICTAAYLGDAGRVRDLLREDPSLANRPSEYVSYYPCSGTPLRNAAAAGHRGIVELLLDAGADPNLPEEGIAPRGHALYSAVYHRHIEIARLLLEHGAHPNVEVESSADTLSIALLHGDAAMVALLCSYGAARPVHLLAHYGDVQTAAAVFAANPALADDAEALGSAAGHEGFVRLMLRYSPDLPRRVAVAGGTREITELLFEHGMDPSRPDWLRITPLHRFAERGDVEHAALFIEHGADLEARDEEFRSTPLGYAAKYGRARMAAFLLRRGARPGAGDGPAWAAPLAWARRRGHEGIAAMLEACERDGTVPPEAGVAEWERLAGDLVEACGGAGEGAGRGQGTGIGRGAGAGREMGTGQEAGAGRAAGAGQGIGAEQGAGAGQGTGTERGTGAEQGAGAGEGQGTGAGGQEPGTGEGGGSAQAAVGRRADAQRLAAERVAAHFEIDPRTWNTGRSVLDEVRRRVRDRLRQPGGAAGGGAQGPAAGGAVPLSTEQARDLVARWEGFRDWAALASDRAEAGPEAGAGRT